MALISCGSAICGCASSGQPQISPATYTGPALSVDSTGATQRVVLVAPTGGWSISFDRSRKLFERTEVFITINRPNPAYPTTQATVLQNLDTAVDTRESVVIFARVLDFGKRQGPYEQAAASATKSTSAPPPQ